MNKKSFKIGLIVVASVVLVGHFTEMDYNDLSWSANSGAYLGIIAMICIIISMALSLKNQNQQK